MPFTLSDYADIKELAKGGMGKIYLATQLSLNRKVVIKEMAAGLLTTKNEIKRFENEARAGAALNHDHIVRIYDFGEEKSSFYIAMEFIDGPDLDALLKDADFPRQIGMMILQQALKGLAFAHEQGIVHRDVKPANILVSRNGAVKMVDFGLAYAGAQSGHMTVTGSIVGTPVYMSPELVKGEETRDRCMDIWAAGVILYRIVTGKFPFSGETVPATLISIIQDKETPAGEIDPTLPQSISSLLNSSLEKEHPKRLASLGPLIEAMQNYFFEIGIRDPVDAIKKYLADRKASVAELAPLLARYHLVKGEECSRDKRHAAAQAHFQMAKKHDPKNKDIAEALRSQQDYMGSLTAETATVPGGMLSQVRARQRKKKRLGIHVLTVGAAIVSLGIIFAGALAIFDPDTWHAMKAPVVGAFGRIFTFTPLSPSSLQGPAQVQASDSMKKDGRATQTAAQTATAKSDSAAMTPVADTAAVHSQTAKDSTISPPPAPLPQAQEPAGGKALAASGALKSLVKVPETVSGLVKVQVNAAGAMVMVDDRLISAKEMNGIMLTAGTHLVTATADGYTPSTASVTVFGSDTHLVAISLTPDKKSGALEVVSDIAAEIYIDGEFKGNAPTGAPIVLSEGQHTVTFKRPGFTPYVKTVAIKTGETARVKVEGGKEGGK
ncbi:MAG TPA: serine/threonine-protein kinase [Chitinivibrionales bacterium]|nr:serine/threonine-protein kinase [Chitinivibrionales bacterium]